MQQTTLLDHRSDKDNMQVEDVKTALLLHGPRTSQVTKDVLADLHKLRTVCTGHTCMG